MTHAEFMAYVDTLTDTDRMDLLRLILSDEMRDERGKIWLKNYKEKSNTQEWRDIMQKRDALLGKLNPTAEESAEIEKLDEKIDDLMCAEFYDLVKQTFERKH